MITIVTTTIGRPGCFALLDKYVARQTVKPDQWLVVGEHLRNYKFTMGQEVIRRKYHKDTLPSICENWLAALPLIRGDRVFVFEDDDWYHPEYLETLLLMLEKCRLVGVKGDLYFKMNCRKYMRMGNMDHASLAATAFRAEMLPYIERCRLHKSVFIDNYLWSEGTQGNLNWSLIPNASKDRRALHVGFKQMPGAVGLGKGHTSEGAADPRLTMLSSWIGPQDIAPYRKIPRNCPGWWMP